MSRGWGIGLLNPASAMTSPTSLFSSVKWDYRNCSAYLLEDAAGTEGAGAFSTEPRAWPVLREC